MRIVAIIIGVLWCLSVPLSGKDKFRGGPVRDSPKINVLTKIRAINENRLNQFNVIKSTADEKLAVLEAISRILGEPSPANLNPSLVISEDSAVNELATAIVQRYGQSPDDFIFSSAMERYNEMSMRTQGYRAYLTELAQKSNQNLTITERQRVKAEMGYLESRIKLDRDFLQLSAETDKLLLKSKQNEIRERNLRDDALDNFIR